MYIKFSPTTNKLQTVTDYKATSIQFKHAEWQAFTTTSTSLKYEKINWPFCRLIVLMTGINELLYM